MERVKNTRVRWLRDIGNLLRVALLSGQSIRRRHASRPQRTRSHTKEGDPKNLHKNCKIERALFHGQVGEIGVGGGVGPERDLAVGFTEFEVVDDQNGLGRSVDVEPGGGAGNDDLHFGPGAGIKIDVGLVDAWIFLAKAMPGIVGGGDVLGRVVAAELVLAAGVGGAEVEVFALAVLVLNAEGEADESARVGRSAGARAAGDFEFDGSVFEVGASDDGEHIAVGVRGVSSRGEVHGMAAAVSRRLRSATDGGEVLRGVEGKVGGVFRVAGERGERKEEGERRGKTHGEPPEKRLKRMHLVSRSGGPWGIGIWRSNHIGPKFKGWTRTRETAGCEHGS